MFVKPITILNKKTGERYRYYRLCESYRVGDNPRHRTILNLGKLEKLPDPKDHKLLADCIEGMLKKEGQLFETYSPIIKKLAEYFAKIIINRKLVDVSIHHKGKEQAGLIKKEADYDEIDLNSIRHEEVREVGAEWLCKQTIERLNLEECLRQLGWEERWIKLALIYITGRAVFPVSDNKTEQWLRQNTWLAELYNLEASAITRHHLYQVSKKLYKNKADIEKYLFVRATELFDTGEKILLYDLTNTYFEGEKKYSKKARFGRSKEKRNDAKLITLGMVTNREGFVKFSKLLEGNIKDSKTLEMTIKNLEEYSSSRVDSRKIIVMDAGIATNDNLKMLREKGYDYVVVSLSKMREYIVEDNKGEFVEFRDKKENIIKVRWLETPDREDRILHVKSEKKKLKEASMEEQFCKRFEEGLAAVQKGIAKKGGVKKLEKVYERVGRLKEKYSSVQRLYEIDVSRKNGIATKIEWNKAVSKNDEHGAYCIRTTLTDKNEKTVWDVYNIIREIEATFRCLKTDLNIRPIFHQKDIYSESHIYGSILAYTLVNSIRHPLKLRGIKHDWGNIVRVMNSQKIVTTAMKTKTNRTIYIQKCSEPAVNVAEIYRTLGYKSMPFWQKKSVLPKFQKPNSQTPDTPAFFDY